MAGPGEMLGSPAGRVFERWSIAMPSQGEQMGGGSTEEWTHEQEHEGMQSGGILTGSQGFGAGKLPGQQNHCVVETPGRGSSRMDRDMVGPGRPGPSQ